MKKRERVYNCCGKVSLTSSKAEKCSTCQAETRYEAVRKVLRTKLEALYENVCEGERTHYGRLTWTFTHSHCGTRQTWTATNLEKQMKMNPDEVPCKKCGGTRRMKSAIAGYVAKYGRTFDASVWDSYRLEVRKLTEATYRLHKAEINPLNLKRSMKDFDLDHKLPIIEGFVQGLEPSVIAAKENLQMLTATVNLTKGRRPS